MSAKVKTMRTTADGTNAPCATATIRIGGKLLAAVKRAAKHREMTLEEFATRWLWNGVDADSDDLGLKVKLPDRIEPIVRDNA